MGAFLYDFQIGVLGGGGGLLGRNHFRFSKPFEVSPKERGKQVGDQGLQAKIHFSWAGMHLAACEKIHLAKANAPFEKKFSL